MGELNMRECPFCGCDAWIIEDRGDNGSEPLLYRPQCKMCGGGLGGFQFRDNAITAWNARPQAYPDCHVCGGDCSSANPPVSSCPRLTRPRTEGRGEGEPVAWQEAAEPFFRLAREVINPVNGERPWHADSKDWMVVFSFGGQSMTLGDLRRAAVASPIREPEISREAVKQLVRKAIEDAQDSAIPEPWEVAEHHAGIAADAILNLAPVGGRGEEGSSQSQPGVSAVQQPALPSAQHFDGGDA